MEVRAALTLMTDDDRDGVHFPSQPAEYLHEARHQTQELYSSRRFRVDVAWLTLAVKV